MFQPVNPVNPDTFALSRNAWPDFISFIGGCFPPSLPTTLPNNQAAYLILGTIFLA